MPVEVKEMFAAIVDARAAGSDLGNELGDSLRIPGLDKMTQGVCVIADVRAARFQVATHVH